MESRGRIPQYNAFFLFDAHGGLWLSGNPGGERITPATMNHVKEALHTKRVIMSDLQGGSQGNNIDIDLLAPLTFQRA
jgi:hypothetical protein